MALIRHYGRLADLRAPAITSRKVHINDFKEEAFARLLIPTCIGRLPICNSVDACTSMHVNGAGQNNLISPVKLPAIQSITLVGLKAFFSMYICQMEDEWLPTMLLPIAVL